MEPLKRFKPAEFSIVQQKNVLYTSQNAGKKIFLQKKLVFLSRFRYVQVMTKDLTQGKPFNLILGFSVPLLFGYLFQQFYNIVDTVIVGKFLGKEALAAVGSTGSVNFLIIGFCMGVCSGFAIPVANKFGAKDFKTMRQLIACSAELSAVFSIAFAILTVLFCKPLLILMQTPSNILDYASNYIRIIFAGIPIVFLYNILAGILRSVGDSRTPLLFLVISSVLNIALDLLFILVFKLGVEGAAYATLLAQLISGLSCLIYIAKKFEILHLTKADWKIRPQLFPKLIRTGFPMGLQYSITAIGSVILQTSVNTLGSDAVAAITAGAKTHIFFCCPFDALGSTMATWAGQNAGAGKLPRIKKGLFQSSLIGLVYSAAAFFVLYFFGKYFGLLFLSAEETEILSMVHFFLISNALFYFPLTLVNVIRFCIQGMGYSRLAVLAGLFELIGRALIAIGFVPKFGFKAACFASPTAWILADIFLIIAFFACYKNLEKKELIFRAGFDETRPEF